MPNPFFTRPNWEDRQIVQYTGTSITLSGDTNINYTGNFRIYKDAFPGLVATSLDNDGTVGWGPISGISWSVSGCTSPLYVNNLVSCPSSGGTIQVDAGNFALNSELNFLIPLSAGTTTDNVLVIDSGGYIKSVSQSSITPIFTGGTGSCITDLYVTNIHGCSPIHIQPTSADDVIMVEGGGNVGIGLLPTVKFHVSGETIVNSNKMMVSDSLTTIPSTGNFRGIFSIHDNVGQQGFVSTNTNPSGVTSIRMYNDLSVDCLLAVGGSQTNRLLTPLTGNNFYRNKILLRGNNTSEGMIFDAAAADPASTFWWEFNGKSGMVLKGDNNTSAYLGLSLNPDGTEMPTSNLQIGGTGTTGTFQYKDGNESSGYVLSSDTDGNASWQDLQAHVQNGNSFGTTSTIGTIDNEEVNVITHNKLALRVVEMPITVPDSGDTRVSVGGAVTRANLHVNGSIAVPTFTIPYNISGNTTLNLLTREHTTYLAYDVDAGVILTITPLTPDLNTTTGNVGRIFWILNTGLGNIDFGGSALVKDKTGATFPSGALSPIIQNGAMFIMMQSYMQQVM